jgi:hypothetical protein
MNPMGGAFKTDVDARSPSMVVSPPWAKLAPCLLDSQPCVEKKRCVCRVSLGGGESCYKRCGDEVMEMELWLVYM